jgi:hypothetical protein
MQNAIGIPLNCGVLSQSPNYIFKKPSMGRDFFRISASPIIRTISSSGSQVIIQKDLQLTANSGASTITDYSVSIQQLVPATYDITIYSTNSGVILAPNQLGIASGVSSGTSSLIATSSDNSFSSIEVTVSGVSATTSVIFNNYITNTLAREVSDAVDNRIAGLNPSLSKPIYTTQNHTTSTYVRNTGCWVSDLDLTSISPWNSTSSNNMAGVLISRRHIIFAAHYQINNGATIRFVDNNNNVITRTMVNKLTHPNYTPYYPDITIGLLDSDVPPSINFAKILPQNWKNYLPSLSSSYTLPCLVLDQEEKALISELYFLETSAAFKSPTNTVRSNFFESIILGDSGNPAFLIIDGELVIITVWTFGGAGAGTSIVYHKDAINSMMASLGGGYSLTEIDLNSFLFFNL